ncbi:hypothetical protein [Aurantiacibacter spongiae]|uniref:Aspartate-semialdehyde dehydrogenase n=1 Tax=Aurantiacibacter spongiae TaxID=2488860 RepID=A0A3N5CNS5_9SPHN|nr:hypothetical protein [Aurantiacibacter spongiae]RPF70594.1 hypothetical protein EG799_02360 [Aurantiacibacter spongiae]
MRATLVLAIPALLLAAGCSQEADPDGTANQQAFEEPTVPADEATLDLEANGIVVPAQGGFERLSAPFGSLRDATETTLATVLGEVTGRADNADCPAGPLATTEYDGITLYFQDGEFAGYAAREPYVPELSRAEMVADPGVSLVEGSTLGEEFTIGQEGGPLISGLFSGEGDDARVETLWAGTVCNFR